MELTEFQALLDRYGSALEAWPESEAAAARRFMDREPAAAAAHSHQRELEALIANSPAPEFPGLEARVAAQALPPRRVPGLDRLLSYLLPAGGGPGLWRPAVAACLPLVMGVVLGNYFSFGIVADEQDLLDWDEELMLLSLVVAEEAQALP